MTMTIIEDGAIYLFTPHAWVWSFDDSAWYETHSTEGRIPTPDVWEFWNDSHQVPLELQHPGKEQMKTKDQITIEALQAQLIANQQVLEKVCEERNSLYREPPGVGGRYRRVSNADIAKSDLVSVDKLYWEPNKDDFVITWSQNARVKFRLGTPHYAVSHHTFLNLPSAVYADSWWHLCAQVGLIEPVARLFYHHPENGQESAVAKAKPVQRGPIIACQGDWID